jgi:hypothetical protein
MKYGLYKAIVETDKERINLYSYGDNESEVEIKIRDYIGNNLSRITSIKKVCNYELLDGSRGFEVKETLR